ncbi:hypothetical protein IQE94_10430 [Synechocystis sp. PCC 7339]|uniref:hypothetical protein n=1 Tax=Synechocystis sp. PCC 7339 TaxID=2782213 RepID=UPI001CBAF88F|nr:hypothetical protein [Synechocystis sp. PCC 7339]UAJ71571.1 hypothetical protein IQE94_10430 [Synechocystis sp. PCC 7339]
MTKELNRWIELGKNRYFAINIKAGWKNLKRTIKFPQCPFPKEEMGKIFPFQRASRGILYY